MSAWPTGEEFTAAARLSDRAVIVEAEAAHIRQMNLRDFDLVTAGSRQVIDSWFTALQRGGPAYCGIIDGRPVVAFGFVSFWQGQAECWMIADECLPQYTRVFHRAVLRGLPWLFIQMQLNRLQMTIHSSNTLAERWSLALGFDFEGVLRNYGPDGSDYLMMSVIK